MKCFFTQGRRVVFFLCLYCILVPDVQAQTSITGGTLTNFEMLASLGNDLIEKVVQKSGMVSKNASVFLTISKKDSTNWFLEKGLSRYLIGSGYEIFTALNDTLSKAGNKNYLIQFNTIDIGIKYKPDIKVDLKLERTGFLNVDFKITDGHTKQVLLNDVFFESVQDWVDVSERENLENQNIDFTIGEITEGLPSVRFKPLIITAVTGTVVYLFYALRSR